MTISNRVKAMRNAAKMRVRGYRNSGNKTPTGLTIWTKTIKGVTKRKTANGTPVNRNTTTNHVNNNNWNSRQPNMMTNSYNGGYSNFKGPTGNRTGGIPGMN